MTRSASRPTRNAPRRLTPIRRSKILGRGLEQRLLEKDAGVVDQNVDAAAAGEDRLDHAQHLGLVGDIGLHGKRAATAARDLGRDRLDPIRRGAVRHGHLRSLRCECQRDRPAYAARAARDQRTLALERAHHAISSP